MMRAKKALLLLPAFLVLAICLTSHSRAEDAEQAAKFGGQILAYWVAQATAEDGPADLDATVAALSEAVEGENPNAKRDAADALAALGPRARAALPVLLSQFAHEAPWVRVSCQAAVGSMGKDAVDALIKTFENNTGGPRLRAAFVLGGIGADAKPAVPVIVRIMKEETPVMQDRMMGVLQQIDPEQFLAAGVTGRATYEPAADQSPIDVATTDWPQFHGPARDSICRETGLLQQWPEGGPELLWTLKGLGRGYSTISIVGDRMFTMGDLADTSGEEKQFVIAYELSTRKQLWATPVGPPHTDGGPRCTPTVDGDVLYAIGTDGDLVCLDADSGKTLWRKSFVEDFQGKFMSVWKFSESPLVDGDRLICTPGGPEAMMVALNKHTGELIWKSTMPEIGDKGVDGAGYSSAVVAEICGVRQYVQMVGRGVIGVEAETGQFLWGYNPVANTVANITSPAVRGDFVFATTAYNTGAALLKICRDGESFRADEVYFIKSKEFQNHHGGIVLLGDYIYGGSGGNKGYPTCIELATGKIMWQERGPGHGSAAVVYADGHLIYRYDRGEVLLIEATPEALKIKGVLQAAEDEGPAWAHPVIHKGKLYLRHANSLFCYDVSSLTP